MHDSLYFNSIFTDSVVLFYYSAPVGEQSIAMSVSVCDSVFLYACPFAYLKNRTAELHQIFCLCCCIAMTRSFSSGVAICCKDDVVFSYFGPNGGVLLPQQRRARAITLLLHRTGCGVS